MDKQKVKSYLFHLAFFFLIYIFNFSLEIHDLILTFLLFTYLSSTALVMVLSLQ